MKQLVDYRAKKLSVIIKKTENDLNIHGTDDTMSKYRSDSSQIISNRRIILPGSFFVKEFSMIFVRAIKLIFYIVIGFTIL